MDILMPFLYRLLIGCLVIWLVDKALSVFEIPARVSKVIQILTLILALAWILFGWMLP
jgi:hypothetical protein